MTKKQRYRLEHELGNIYSFNDYLKGFTSSLTCNDVLILDFIENIVALLNKLYEENEQLRKENKELQGKASSWKITASEQIMEQSKLIKENGQLKSTIKEVVELLSEEVDLFSDKATEHDINAYVELNKLDNKDAYYMATATKKAIKMLKELQK